MSIALIIVLVVVLAVILVRGERRKITAVRRDLDGLRISFNRPSLRTDFQCWLMNASVHNTSASPVTIRALWFDSRSDENAYRGPDDDRIPEPQRQKLISQIHQLLSLPLTLGAGASVIGIVAFPGKDAERFTHPEKHVVIAETNIGELRYPLWWMGAS